MYVRRTPVGRKSKQKNQIGLIVLTVLLILAVAVTAVILLTQPSFKLLQKNMTVELGSELRLDKASIVEADPKVFDLIEIDTAAVNMKKTGEYPVKIRYEDDEKVLTVVVKDTTPPAADLVPGDITVMVGKSITASDLVVRYED